MISPKQAIQSLAFCFVIGLVPSLAHALAVDDVTFRILPDDYRPADAVAELQDGNDNVDDINDLPFPFDGDSWYLLDKSDSGGPGTEYMGVTFELSAPETTSGAWVLSWAETGEPGLPLEMDFTFVTKAGTSWGAYLFEDVVFTSDPLTGDGTFEITWENNGGNIPDLSHASIYGRGGPYEEIPVPGTALLLGLVLIPLGMSRRRRR
jgi:hypothetical protein